MTLQERNAGNAGDLLKHALLCELLANLSPRDRWHYAETHAGAGAYETPNARRIAAILEPGSQVGGAGAFFAGLLRRWWGLTPAPEDDTSSGGRSRTDLYPGSPVLALLSGRLHGGMTLTEADRESAARLRETLSSLSLRTDAGRPGSRRLETTPAVAPKICTGAFEDHLPELTASFPLLLLVDPYYYAADAADGRGGRLGRRHLARILDQIAGRDAILLLFASRLPRELRQASSAGPTAEQGTWRQMRDDLLALTAGSSLRCLQVAKTPHGVIALGWGSGHAVVQNLPRDSEWARSWLATAPAGVRLHSGTPEQ